MLYERAEGFFFAPRKQDNHAGLAFLNINHLGDARGWAKKVSVYISGLYGSSSLVTFRIQ